MELSQLDYCTYLLRVIEERRNELKPYNQLWLTFYRGFLAEKLQQWEEAEDNYKYLEVQEGWPSELRVFLVSKLIGITRKAQSHISTVNNIKPNEKKSTEYLVGLDIQSEINMLEGFYRQKQNESKVSFNLALIASGIGFLIIISGILGAFFWNTEIAVVTSAAGIVSQVTASLLFFQNKRASSGIDECQKDLVKMRNLSRALHIANVANIPSSEREKCIIKILDELTGIKHSSN